MEKLIPLSVIIASFAIPMFFAGRPKPHAKLRLVMILAVGYILIWTQLVLRVYTLYVSVD